MARPPDTLPVSVAKAQRVPRRLGRSPLDRGVSPGRRPPPAARHRARHRVRLAGILGSHPAAIGAVIHGQADVAAIKVSGDDAVSGRMALAMHGGPAAKGLAVIALTEAAPTDALLLTDRLSLIEAERIEEKLFPSGHTRARSFLFAVMEAEGFEKARMNEYRPLLRMLRGADAPTSSTSSARRSTTPPPFPSTPPPPFSSTRPPPPPSRPSSQAAQPPSRPSQSTPGAAPSRPPGARTAPPPPPSSQAGKKPFF